jgi:hypothetical protein
VFIIRVTSARLAAAPGCKARPSVVDLAESSATTSEMAVDGSSMRAGSMRSTLSTIRALADLLSLIGF